MNWTLLLSIYGGLVLLLLIICGIVYYINVRWENRGYNVDSEGEDEIE